MFVYIRRTILILLENDRFSEIGLCRDSVNSPSTSLVFRNQIKDANANNIIIIPTSKLQLN